jgi:hypothetical protein
MGILCPILKLIKGGIISQVDFKQDTPDFGNNGLPKEVNQKIILEDRNDSYMSKYYFRNSINVSNTDILFNFSTFEEKVHIDTDTVIEEFINLVCDLTKDTEETEDRDPDMNEENYCGYYGGLTLFKESNDNYLFYDVVELINARLINGVPVYTSIFLGKII